MQNDLRFTIQYELTRDLVQQAGADLLEFHLAHLKKKHPEWGTTRPLLILGLAALQLVLAVGLMIWVSDGMDTITISLLLLAGIALVVLLFKASFYALPFLGQWLMRWQSGRYLRSLENPRIIWRLYEDRLETESAVTQRRIPWSNITSMTLFGQSMILGLKKQELVMPASVLNKEVMMFLQEHIAS